MFQGHKVIAPYVSAFLEVILAEPSDDVDKQENLIRQAYDDNVERYKVRNRNCFKALRHMLLL